MKYILSTLLLMLQFSLFSQTKDEVINKVIAEYSLKKPLQYHATYNLYKDYNSHNVNQSYTGEYYKNELDDTYVKIDQTEYFITKKLTAQISHSEKAILISSTTGIQQEFDIKEFLKVLSIGEFKDLKTHWEVELLPKNFSGLPYSKVVLHIGKNYLLKKQVFYYNTAMNFSEDYKKNDLSYPRLEITFKDVNRNAISAKQFDTSKIFVLKGGKINLSAGYSNYQLIDQRLK
ncbi:hypothetical protein [Flavobacterium beibuense]|nr:hypothetical protein [Flavobacterium beibuense]